MSTPLHQDVLDVIDSLDHLGALFLMAPTCRTKTGRDLANLAFAELRRRADLATKMQTLAEQLAAEVDGLRTQNAMLTELLQRQP